MRDSCRVTNSHIRIPGGAGEVDRDTISAATRPRHPSPPLALRESSYLSSHASLHRPHVTLFQSRPKNWQRRTAPHTAQAQLGCHVTSHPPSVGRVCHAQHLPGTRPPRAALIPFPDPIERFPGPPPPPQRVTPQENHILISHYHFISSPHAVRPPDGARVGGGPATYAAVPRLHGGDPLRPSTAHRDGH
jgi:hypothetical protein